jgi:bile acid:Na+ symporter, BASS family
MVKAVIMFLLHYLVFALVLAVGLRTSLAGLRRGLQRRRLVTRTVVVANFLVPLMALAVVAVLPLGPGIEALILIMAICPGAPLFLNRFHREETLPSVLLVVVSLVGLVSVPWWAWAIDQLLPFHFQATAAGVLAVLAKSVLLPLALGLAIRHFLPRVAAPLAIAAEWFYKIALVAAALLALVRGLPAVWHAPLIGVIAVLLMTAAAVALGHWAGGPDPQDRRAVANLAALGNPGLALAILAQSYPSVHVLEQAPPAAAARAAAGGGGRDLSGGGPCGWWR